jgi:hypothetical protein
MFMVRDNDKSAGIVSTEDNVAAALTLYDESDPRRARTRGCPDTLVGILVIAG